MAIANVLKAIKDKSIIICFYYCYYLMKAPLYGMLSGAEAVWL